MHLRSLSAVLSFVLLAPVAAAGTLVVGPAGTSAQYNALEVAVAAAMPGDTILIQPGLYGTNGPLVIDKSLSIVGAGSDLVSYTGTSHLPHTYSLFVRDLQANATLTISGIRFENKTLTHSQTTPGVYFQDCLGPVTLSDVTVVTGSQGDSAVHVTNMANLTLNHFSVQANGAAVDGTATAHQSGLSITDSHVHVNDSIITGAGANILSSLASGGPGIKAVNSTLRVSRSTITGGPSSSAGFIPVVLAPGRGGAGIEAESSKIYVRGGGSQIRGGDGWPLSGLGGPLNYSDPGSAIQVDVGSFVTVAPDAVLFGGADAIVIGAVAPDIGGVGTQVHPGQALGTLGVSPSIGSLGSSVQLSLGGASNSALLPFFATSNSLVQGTFAAIPGIYGLLAVNPAAATQLPTQTLDGLGQGQLTVAIPQIPSLVGLTFIVQGLNYSATGLASFTAPSTLAIAN